MNVVLYLNWFYVIQYQYNTAVIFSVNHLNSVNMCNALQENGGDLIF